MEQKYVMAAIDAALKASEEILSIYEDPASDFEIERKADNSPLTIADRKAHEAIVAVLSKKGDIWIMRSAVNGIRYGLWILWMVQRNLSSVMENLL